MKKLICFAMCVVMLLMLCACAGKQPSQSAEDPSQEAQTAAEWTRNGYFQELDAAGAEMIPDFDLTGV